MEDLELKIKLFSKLNKIQSAIGQLEPDGKNEYSKYSFISSNQLLIQLNKLFSKEGIIVIPNIVDSTFQEVGKTQGGATINYTKIKMKFDICDCESGYVYSAEFEGADLDSQGKDHSQSITQCHKRFFMKLFNIAEKGNEPDANYQEPAAQAVNEGGQAEFTQSIQTDQGTIINTGKAVPKAYWEKKDKSILGGAGYFPWKDETGQWMICTKGE